MGKAIITQAIKEMVALGFKTYDRIFAIPFGNNIGLQKVLDKAGFTLEARYEQIFFKNGIYEDELIYAVGNSIF